MPLKRAACRPSCYCVPQDGHVFLCPLLLDRYLNLILEGLAAQMQNLGLHISEQSAGSWPPAAVIDENRIQAS